jgi:predicted deacylase
MPLVNPYGFQAGMRADPDLVELNRRFPGNPKGIVTDQIAHALFQFLKETVTAVVDLHSGTVVRTTEYAYDYGNLPFSASFGLVPVMVGQAIPGQLCTALSEVGLQTTLVEFGGPDRTGAATGVEGCLNVLRFRGHLSDAPTGPERVEIIDTLQKVRVSTDGIFRSPFGPKDVGKRIPAGDLGFVMNAASGRVLERFHVDARPQGEPILMLASTTPVLVRPGELVYILGWSCGDIPTPRFLEEASCGARQ